MGTWWHKGARGGLGTVNGRAWMEVCCLLTPVAQVEIKLFPCQNFRQCLESAGTAEHKFPCHHSEVVGESHCLLSLFLSSDKNKGNEGHEGRTKSLHRVHWLSICNRLWRSSSCIWRGPSGVKSHVPKQTEGFLCQSLCISFLSLIISYPQPFTSSIF